MKKRVTGIVGTVVLAIALMAFTGSALAGNGNGNGGKSANAPGHNKGSTNSPSPNASPKAQHHVILCHKTGSTSHPWVVINVDIAAWPAHKAHGDFLLKDPAKPGEKMPVSACPHAGAPTGAAPTSAAAPSGAAASGPTSSAGSVAGVTATRHGGVLGARTGVAGRRAVLPFTGFPVWIGLLLGFALTAAGLGLRRYARRTV